ncbi:MAG TPA: hypothetical protein VFH61_01335 [Thermoleophilia bacterium]|nr:hypothetical protein [Thermoleophilia bacterium]
MGRGMVSIDVSFPVLKGIKDDDLIKGMDKMIASALKGAIDVIRVRWYELVTRRTGESGRMWNVIKQALFSYVIENRATTERGKYYANYVHSAGQTSTLVNTMVKRVLARTRKEITSWLLSARKTGNLPDVKGLTFKQAIRDNLISSFVETALSSGSF